MEDRQIRSRAYRGVRVRGADAELPGRVRHERPLARRCPRGGARRPWVGTLCVSVVLTVQCLLFADGGVSALGLNIINMAMVGAFGGYAIFLVVKKVLPRTKGGVTVASGIAAGLAPPLAALMFTLEYALGGNGGRRSARSRQR